MLTEDKYPQFKRTVLWYKHGEQEDAYRNKKLVYDEPVEIPNIMITPRTMYNRDETALVLYGETDEQECQFVYYGGMPIKKLDVIEDGDNAYKVVAVLNYQTHRIITLEALTSWN